MTRSRTVGDPRAWQIVAQLDMASSGATSCTAPPLMRNNRRGAGRRARRRRFHVVVEGVKAREPWEPLLRQQSQLQCERDVFGAVRKSEFVANSLLVCVDSLGADE